MPCFVQIARSHTGGIVSRIIRKSAVYVALAGALMAATLGGAVLHATQTEAASQTQINRYIRSHDGIPPCAEEDGSDQPRTTCVWWGRFGNGKGESVLLVPDGRDKDDDKDVIFITGPLAVRNP